jgi:hypothetical protein
MWPWKRIMAMLSAFAENMKNSENKKGFGAFPIFKGRISGVIRSRQPSGPKAYESWNE